MLQLKKELIFGNTVLKGMVKIYVKNSTFRKATTCI